MSLIIMIPLVMKIWNIKLFKKYNKAQNLLNSGTQPLIEG